MPRRPVREVMQREVVTLHPEMSARDAERVLAEHRIGGAPVVDDDGRLVGVLTQSDLVRLDADRPTTAAAGAFFSDVEDYRDIATLPADESVVPVSRVMSPRVLAIEPDAPIEAAARLMREHRVHRLLCVERDRLCGLVSAYDLLVALTEPAPPSGSSAASR